MRRVLVTLVVLVLALAAQPLVQVAGAAPASAVAATSVHRFGREVVRRGDVDADPYHIEHVIEVQRRLERLGLYSAAVDGRFGPVTEAGVKAFQRRNDLRATGVVGRRTWSLLIRQSLGGRRAVPAGCRKRGWHACYDRQRHQVSLYHRGTLLNSWLVRGGAADMPTRTGRFRVYYRDIDHVSGLFDTPMPYSQFFSGGQALHGSRLMMDPYVGHSHGCVNFWTEDARQLWNLTSTRPLWVHVYGRWD